jgi:TonB family protein
MEAEGKVKAAAASSAGFARVAPLRPRERLFWIALACAAVVHAALIVSFVRSPPRQLGEKGGSAEGVAVEMVSAADLNSRNTFGQEGSLLPGSPPPRRSAPPSPKEAETPPEHEQPKQKAVPPAEVQTPRPVSPEEAARQPKEGKEKEGRDQKAQKQTADEWPIDVEALERQADRKAKSHDLEPSAKSAAKQKPRQQAVNAMPPLQLDLPDSAISFGPSVGGLSRPAGITRSGENDEFGRGVIRALRRTMPDPGTSRGRVTVRILLSTNGNLVEVKLVRSSGDPVLDQSVLFAVRQSSFPFPPAESKEVDRIFLVTYVYESRSSG